MAVTAGHPRTRWTILLRPRWLAWHGFAVVATAGMLYLGDWQLHRAESGNELSWAYTFEWPLFAIFGVYFWAKTLRDELRSQADAGTGAQATTTDAKANPADASAGSMAPAADAYVERLKSEVRGHGKWHGWR
jgi:DNA-binding transcriptional regulator of glucitol operon